MAAPALPLSEPLACSCSADTSGYHKSRQLSESLQIFEERLLLLVAQARAELMTASAVS